MAARSLRRWSRCSILNDAPGESGLLPPGAAHRDSGVVERCEGSGKGSATARINIVHTMERAYGDPVWLTSMAPGVEAGRSHVLRPLRSSWTSGRSRRSFTGRSTLATIRPALRAGRLRADGDGSGSGASDIHDRHLVFFVGAGLNRVIPPLQRWNIREAVTGGLNGVNGPAAAKGTSRRANRPRGPSPPSRHCRRS